MEKKQISFWQCQWLKDANGDWSFARVCAFACIIANLIWRLYIGIDNINNVWQAVVGCCGMITGVLLWLIEIFRKLPNFEMKIGDKEYKLKKGEL